LIEIGQVDWVLLHDEANTALTSVALNRLYCFFYVSMDAAWCVERQNLKTTFRLHVVVIAFKLGMINLR